MGVESGNEAKSFEKNVTKFSIEMLKKEEQGENKQVSGGEPDAKKKGGKSYKKKNAAYKPKVPQEESKNDKRPEQIEGTRKVFFRQ